MAELEEILKKRERDGLLRTLRPHSGRRLGRIRVLGKEYIDLSSNDYLGLSEHPDLREESKKAIDQFGCGSSASRLMSGDLELHHQLESQVARFKNKESALVFNSGYQANLGIISALYGEGDCIFCDRLSHASIIDGVLLSGARFFRFQHNDLKHLESLLKSQRHKFKKCLIATETIFSMDGDAVPLKGLVLLKERYDASLYVDEAHATGVFGPTGAGLVEKEGLQEKVDLVMGTFSKALGGFGAYIAASKETIDYLINTSRSFIYSTALPPAVIASNLASLEVIRKEPWRRERLLTAAEYFRSALKEKGFKVIGVSQIVPLVIGENSKTLEAANALREKGYWVLPVRPPTVPEGQARLRFSLTIYHEKEILDGLINDILSIKI